MRRLVTSIMINIEHRWRSIYIYIYPSVVGDFLFVVCSCLGYYTIPLLKHAQLMETCEGTEEVAKVATCIPRQR